MHDHVFTGSKTPLAHKLKRHNLLWSVSTVILKKAGFTLKVTTGSVYILRGGGCRKSQQLNVCCHCRKTPGYKQTQHSVNSWAQSGRKGGEATPVRAARPPAARRDGRPTWGVDFCGGTEGESSAAWPRCFCSSFISPAGTGGPTDRKERTHNGVFLAAVGLKLTLKLPVNAGRRDICK